MVLRQSSVRQNIKNRLCPIFLRLLKTGFACLFLVFIFTYNRINKVLHETQLASHNEWLVKLNSLFTDVNNTTSQFTLQINFYAKLCEIMLYF